MSDENVIPFKPIEADPNAKPNMVPPEIESDPDPRVKELYLEAYGYVRGSTSLSNLTAAKRTSWIQGFMNGCICYRNKFEKLEKREIALQFQLEQMGEMKAYIDKVSAELENNYESKDIHAAQESVPIEHSSDNLSPSKGT